MGVSNTLRPLDLLGISTTLLLALIIFNFKVQIGIVEKNSDQIYEIVKKMDELNLECKLIKQEIKYIQEVDNEAKRDISEITSEFRSIKDNIKNKR